MANRVFSVAAVALSGNAVMSSLSATPAAAWTHHRHVRVYGYAPAPAVIGLASLITVSGSAGEVRQV
jgi:hypothetical protein